MTKAKIDEKKLRELAKKMEKEQYKNLTEKEIQEKKEKQEEIRQKNICALNDTLNILEKRLDKAKMQKAKVFLPSDIDRLRIKASIKNKGQMFDNFSCENMDVLDLAQKRCKKLEKIGQENSKILILNLASATTPGGRVHDGANAQEEELCRRTSLLLSLESKQANKYYDYNKKEDTYMGTDAIILSPYVEVLKNSSGNLLKNSFNISTISCSAPMIRLGLEGISQEEYEHMLYKRIEGIFLVAASQNYRHLILGAFGCGAYGNDAAVISKIFYQVINNFTYDKKNASELFDTIDFAVLSKKSDNYNYNQFNKLFSNER